MVQTSWPLGVVAAGAVDLRARQQGGAVVAEVRVAVGAGRAAAAGRDEGEDDVVARRDPGDALADLEHDAGALVTADDGRDAGQVAGADVVVGVAHAGGHHLHEDLTGLGRVELDLLDRPLAAGSHRIAAWDSIRAPVRTFRHPTTHQVARAPRLGTMRLDPQECRVRACAAAGHGVLATTRPDGRPHAVPVCFSLVSNQVVVPHDHVKPKVDGPAPAGAKPRVRSSGGPADRTVRPRVTGPDCGGCGSISRPSGSSDEVCIAPSRTRCARSIRSTSARSSTICWCS